MPSTTFKKHHFDEWKTDFSGLGGLAKVTLMHATAYSNCTRCKVQTMMGKTGGVKFWTNGRWTSKRPPCVVNESTCAAGSCPSWLSTAWPIVTRK